MSESRTVTKEVLVINGDTVVPVRHLGEARRLGGEWLVGNIDGRFVRTVDEFDAALALAERIAEGLERLRVLRSVVQEEEDRLYAATVATVL